MSRRAWFPPDNGDEWPVEAAVPESPAPINPAPREEETGGGWRRGEEWGASDAYGGLVRYYKGDVPFSVPVSLEADIARDAEERARAAEETLQNTLDVARRGAERLTAAEERATKAEGQREALEREIVLMLNRWMAVSGYIMAGREGTVARDTSALLNRLSFTEATPSESREA